MAIDVPPDSALVSILEQTAEALQADVVAVLLLDASAPALELEAAAGLDGESPVGDRYGLDQGLGGQAVSEGHAVFASRQTGEPQFAWPSLQRLDFRTGVAVPIIQAGRAIGVLEAYRTDPTPFEPYHAAIMQPLGGGVALALENRRLLLQEGDRRKRAAALMEVALATTSTLDLNEVLERVVATTAGLTGADRCSIWLLDETKTKLMSAAIFGIDSSFAAQWRRRTMGLEQERLSHWVLSQGAPLVIYDAASHPLTDKRAVSFFGDKSIVVVPLSCRGEALGTLFLNYIYRFHAFTAEEVEFTVTLANQVAVAIHNAQLYEETREVGEALRWSMRQMGHMPANPDLDAIFGIIVEVASRLLRVPVCAIRLVDERSDELPIRAVKGMEPVLQERWRLRAGEGFSGRVVRAATPLWTEDLWEHPNVALPQFVREAGLRGYLGVPLLIQGRAVGVINVYTPEPHRFSSEEIDLLSSFANQAAIAIENVELFQEMERRTEELSQLHEVSRALNATLEFPQVLEVIARSALQITQADRTALFLLDDHTGEVERAVDLPDGRGRLRMQPRPDGLTNLMRRRGEIELIPDTLADPRVRRELIEEGVRSILGMPLRVDDEMIGVLWLNGTRAHHFQPRHVELLAVLANQVAVALKNARLYTYMVQEKEKFAAIFTNSTDGILLVDLQNRVMDLNPALERMTGWRAEEARGQRLSEVLACRNRSGAPQDDLESILQRAPTGTDASPYLEATLHARDGREVEIAASFSPIPHREEGMPTAVCIVRDVTEARRVEEAKSDFVSMVSHELRTPLSLVKGYASTLLREDLAFDEVTRRRFLTNIDEASNRLARLINDLLSISRMELGRFELKRQVLDLRSIAHKVARESKFLANHRLRVRMPAEPLLANVDPDRVEQVLLNLLANAVTYSSPGSELVLTGDSVPDVDQRARGAKGLPPWLRSSLIFASGHLPTDGSWAVLTVADQGVGLAEEDLRRVFEKFYRVERGLESRSSGMGIGLYLAKGFVEAHEGRIWVRSHKGKGSLFGFCLPLEQS